MALNDRLGAHLATFCALVPLTDPRAARAELEGWETAAGSPLHRVAGTHFARFVVLEQLERQVAGQPADTLAGPSLMVSAFFDDDPERWLTALCEAMPDELDAVFRHCRAYPGTPRTQGHAFRAWLGEHRVAATAIFGAYPDATVAEVREALAFRAAFREFAFGLESRRTAKAEFRAFAEGRP